MELMTQYVAMADMPGVYMGTYANPDEWMWEAFGTGRTDSGIRVSADTALHFAPWFQGVATISADVARIPLDIYERDADDNRIKHRDHPAFELLNRRANGSMTAFTLREILQAHALSWGNGYAAIVTQGAEPVDLIPLSPDRVSAQKIAGGEMIYLFRLDDGSDQVYPSSQILHIKGIGYDGLTGYSVYRYARNSLGLGLAAEKHGSTHFRNNARPGLLLKYPAKLDKPQADMLLAQWEARHAGTDNTDRPALLTGGLDAVTVPVSNEDSQWIESRKFQRDEVASWLNMPPHKLGSDSRLSYNSVEAEERSYVSQTLMRWFRRWEAECDIKLLAERQKRKWWYFEHQTGALIQGDFATQSKVAVELKNAKIITRNEARKKFNMDSVDGGDEFENANTSSGGTAPPPPSNAMGAAIDLIKDRVRHLVTTECSGVKRASHADVPSEAIMTFYSAFRSKMANALRPCIRMYRAVGGESPDADEVGRWYCDLSMAALRDMIAAAGDSGIDLATASELEQWPEQRPADVLAHITGDRT